MGYPVAVNFIVLLSIIAVLSAPAFAQHNPIDFSISEIVITARKRAESIQKVPLAVTVFSATDIQRRGIDDAQDIEILTPSFTLDMLGISKVRTAIRGLGSDNTSPGQDFSTAIFLDGIYMSTNGMAAVDVFDIERIEILKGPQGTLWGKNVVGGGINIIPAKPKDIYEASLASTLGSYGQLDVQGMVNIPASTAVSQRLAMSIKTLDGYAENLYTGDKLEDLDQHSFRYSISAEIGDDVLLDLVLDHTEDDNNGRAGHVLGQKPFALDGSVLTSGRSQVWAARANTTDERETLDDSNGFSEREMWGARLNLAFELSDSVTLTSLSAFREIEDGFFHQDDGLDIDQPGVAELAFALGGRAYDFGLGTRDDVNQWSTELRLEGQSSALDWTLGTFYSEERGDQVATFFADWLDCRAGRVGSIDECAANRDTRQDIIDITNKTADVAVFAEATLNLLQRLSLTAGGRWSRNTKDYSWTNQRTLTGTVVSGAVLATPKRDNASWNAATWRLSADYRLSGNLMVYGTVATGFKPGGYGAFIDSAAAAKASAEETAESFEVGLKADIFSGAVRVNLALFKTDLEGLQLVQVNGTEATYANVNNVAIDGFEMDFLAKLSRRIHMDLKYAHLNSTVEGWPGIEGRELTLQRSPKNELSLGLRHQRELASGEALEFGVEYSYRSRVFDDPDNSSGEIRGARELVDAYIGWVNRSGDWSVKIWGKNLNDELYPNRITDSFDSSVVNFGPPRTIGVTVGKRFY